MKALSESKIAEIREHIEDANVWEYVLNPDDQRQKDRLERINAKDRHVLYVAYISKSSFLASDDKKDFRQETVNHEEHKELEFYWDVEAVSFDRFLRILIKEEEEKLGRYDYFLDAVVNTMVHMLSHSVDKIFEKLYEDNEDN